MEGGDSLQVSPLGLIILLVMVFLTWRLPRRKAFIPLLLTAGFLPLGQGVIIFGLSFQFFRLLLLVGMLRLVVRRELQAIRFTTIDKLFFTWCAVALINGTLLIPGVSQFISFSGFVYNALCPYLFFRCLIRDTRDFKECLWWFAIVAALLGVFMLIEKATGKNLFAMFGGVPFHTFARDGKLRCQGPFRHPIVGGAFGATLFPLLVTLWFQYPQRRLLTILGTLGTSIIVITSSSSGALLAVMAAGVGLMIWSLRFQMRWVRYGILASILALALVMKAPVWYIFARLSDMTGGTGWHRSFIIDAAIAHFGEWGFRGTPRTVHWGGYPPPPADPENIDITNQYIVEGVKGGVVRLGLFIAIIVACFRVIGRRTGKPGAVSRQDAILYWGLGVSLFTHSVAFMSVSYFDQTVVFWYGLLATISSLGATRIGIGSVAAKPSGRATDDRLGNRHQPRKEVYSPGEQFSLA